MKQQKPSLGKVIKPNISLRRKISIYLDRAKLVLKILILLFLYLAFFTNQLTFLKNYIMSHIYESAAESGAVLENVLIEGQHNIPTHDIATTLNADVGTPLLSIELTKVREALLQNDWIKDATIERRLPNTIYINIVERTPIAIWQQDKKLYLVDAEGHVIVPQDIKKFVGLIHVIGSDAPLHAFSLNEELEKDMELKKRLTSAIRYGERRWDLNLEQAITIKMPENNFAKAYRYLSKLNESDKLFDNNYKTIDLRDESKYFFEKNQEVKKLEPKKK